jgi:hypothetical protein
MTRIELGSEVFDDRLRFEHIVQPGILRPSVLAAF